MLDRVLEPDPEWESRRAGRAGISRRIAVALVLATVVTARSSWAQDAAVDKGDLPEFFIGKWTIAGQEETFAEECRLLTKNSFVICEGVENDPGQPYQWVRLIGYNHYEDLFTAAEYGGDGSLFQFEGWHDAGNWSFVSHRRYEDRVVPIEDRMVPTERGYTHTRRISINGGEWETRFVDERIRVRD